jgi:hypothetical protein
VYWIEKAARDTQLKLESQRSLALSEIARDKWDDVEVALEEYADDKTSKKLKALKSELTKLSQMHPELESSLKQWQYIRKKGDSNLIKSVMSRTERLIDSLERADSLSVVDIAAELDGIFEAQNLLHKEIETQMEEWKAAEEEYNIEPRTVSNKTEQQVTVSKKASNETTTMNDKKKSRKEMTADARIEDSKFGMFYDIVRLVKKQNEAEKATSPKREARNSEKITVKRQTKTTMPKERPKPGRNGQVVLEDDADEDEGRRDAEKTVQQLHKVVKMAYNELEKLEPSEDAKDIREVKSHIDKIEKTIRRIKSTKWGVRNKVLTSDEKTLRVRVLSQALLDQCEVVDDLLDAYATTNPEKKQEDFVRLASAMRELLQKHLDLKLALERFHINIPDLMGVTSQIKALMSNLREADEDKFGDDFESLEKNLRFINEKLQTLKEVVKEVDENDEDVEQEVEKVQEDEEPEVNEDEQGDAQETTKAPSLRDLSQAALAQWNAVNALFDGRRSTAKVASFRLDAMADLLGKQRAVDDAIDKIGKKNLKTDVALKIDTLISKMKVKKWETFIEDFTAIRDDLITGYKRLKVEPSIQANDKKERGELRKNAKQEEEGARTDEDEVGEDEERSGENVPDGEEEEQSDEESEKDVNDGEGDTESQKSEGEEDEEAKAPSLRELSQAVLEQWSVVDDDLTNWQSLWKTNSKQERRAQLDSAISAMTLLLEKQHAFEAALGGDDTKLANDVAAQIEALISKIQLKNYENLWADIDAIKDALISNDEQFRNLEKPSQSKVATNEIARPIKKKSEPRTVKPGQDNATDKKGRAKIRKKAKQDDKDFGLFMDIVRNVRQVTLKDPRPKND